MAHGVVKMLERQAGEKKTITHFKASLLVS